MLKESLTCLGVGSACLSTAWVSTHFSSSDNSADQLFKSSGGLGKRIEKINSYGDIDAYGLQNGCIFKMLDGDKPYSLTDFLVRRKNEVYGLQETVAKLANKSKELCGKDYPIVTFTYVPIGKAPNIIGTFKIEKTPIKKG